MNLRRSIYKSPAQLRLMVAPGLATAASLDAVASMLRPGVTTEELDAAAEAAIVSRGGRSNFKLEPGYRHTICSSVNEDVVHGIPGDRVLEPGDIVSIDSGAILDGWNGDAARTFVLPDPAHPTVAADRQTLSRVTEQSLWHGIARLAAAKHLNEVGAAIEGYIESQGDYGILRSSKRLHRRLLRNGGGIRRGMALQLEHGPRPRFRNQAEADTPARHRVCF